MKKDVFCIRLSPIKRYFPLWVFILCLFSGCGGGSTSPTASGVEPAPPNGPSESTSSVKKVAWQARHLVSTKPPMISTRIILTPLLDSKVQGVEKVSSAALVKSLNKASEKKWGVHEYATYTLQDTQQTVHVRGYVVKTQKNTFIEVVLCTLEGVDKVHFSSFIAPGGALNMSAHSVHMASLLENNNKGVQGHMLTKKNIPWFVGLGMGALSASSQGSPMDWLSSCGFFGERSMLVDEPARPGFREFSSIYFSMIQAPQYQVQPNYRVLILDAEHYQYVTSAGKYNLPTSHGTPLLTQNDWNTYAQLHSLLADFSAEKHIYNKVQAYLYHGAPKLQNAQVPFFTGFRCPTADRQQSIEFITVPTLHGGTSDFIQNFVQHQKIDAIFMRVNPDMNMQMIQKLLHNPQAVLSWTVPQKPPAGSGEDLLPPSRSPDPTPPPSDSGHLPPPAQIGGTPPPSRSPEPTPPPAGSGHLPPPAQTGGTPPPSRSPEPTPPPADSGHLPPPAQTGGTPPPSRSPDPTPPPRNNKPPQSDIPSHPLPDLMDIDSDLAEQPAAPPPHDVSFSGYLCSNYDALHEDLNYRETLSEAELQEERKLYFENYLNTDPVVITPSQYDYKPRKRILLMGVGTEEKAALLNQLFTAAQQADEPQFITPVLVKGEGEVPYPNFTQLQHHMCQSHIYTTLHKPKYKSLGLKTEFSITGYLFQDQASGDFIEVIDTSGIRVSRNTLVPDTKIQRVLRQFLMEQPVDHYLIVGGINDLGNDRTADNFEEYYSTQVLTAVNKMQLMLLHIPKSAYVNNNVSIVLSDVLQKHAFKHNCNHVREIMVQIGKIPNKDIQSVGFYSNLTEAFTQKIEAKYYKRTVSPRTEKNYKFNIRKTQSLLQRLLQTPKISQDRAMHTYNAWVAELAGYIGLKLCEEKRVRCEHHHLWVNQADVHASYNDVQAKFNRVQAELQKNPSQEQRQRLEGVLLLAQQQCTLYQQKLETLAQLKNSIAQWDGDIKRLYDTITQHADFASPESLHRQLLNEVLFALEFSHTRDYVQATPLAKQDMNYSWISSGYRWMGGLTGKDIASALSFLQQ